MRCVQRERELIVNGELVMDWITAIKEIQKAQEDDRLVVFVGAGVSKNSGVKWDIEVMDKKAD